MMTIRHEMMRLLVLLPLLFAACQPDADFDPAGQALGSTDAEAPDQDFDRESLDLVSRLFLPVTFKAYAGRPYDDSYPAPAEPTEAPRDPEPSEPAPTAEPAPQGECDLAADFVDPTSAELPGGQPASFSVEFVNLGDGLCFDNGVELLRFRGSTGAGTPELVGDLDFLPELAPGDRVTLSWTDQEPPRTGTQMYRIRYELAQEDSDNDNHNPEKVVRYVWEGGGSVPPPPPSNPQPGACDLTAEFSAPTASDLPGGQAVSWRVRFENEGGETCEGNNISLERFSGGTASGVATRIGGSGGFEQLPDLRSGRSTTLTWVENNTPATGTYTYKIRYSSPHNDEDNNNHYPEKTVTYGGGGNQNACDLEASFTSPNGTNLPGGQNETWRLRLRNRGSASCPGGSIRLQRQQGNGPASLFGLGDFQGLAPNQTRDIQWTRTAPQTGTYTYYVEYAPDYDDANNNNHYPKKTVTYGQQGGGNPEDCDLTARFSTPTFNELPGGETGIWQVQFRNEGSGRCEGNNISLERFSGSNASGVATRIGGSGGFEQLNALNAGQLQTLTWRENNTPNTGTYTYKIKYASAHNDTNNNNHSPSKTVTYVQGGGGGGNQACDLEAVFTSPSGSNLTGGERVDWQVRFRNLGNAPCEGNNISLERFSGNNASGVATRIGGSGGFEQLSNLSPNQSRTLTWRENDTPNTGTYTYKIKYASAHNDTNNNNHSPSKTVTYAQGGGGGGQGSCDLEASYVSPTGSVLQGGQSYRWEVRLRNRGNARCDGGTIKLYRYVGERASGQRELLGQTNFDNLSPDASQSYSWTKTSSSAGGVYTYKVEYGSTYRDANNNNHNPTKTVRYRAQGCDLGVELKSPSNDRLVTGRQYTWQVEVTNLGNQQCRDGNLRLLSYEGEGTRGNSTLIGLGEFPRLNQDQSRTISWTRSVERDGTYTYQARLDGWSDANNGNNTASRSYRFD